MTINSLNSALEKVENIKNNGLIIYDPIDIGDPELWLTSEELTILLNTKLLGESFAGLPLRTRSKVAKERVCTALGYPSPKSFKKVQPRFTGQSFDTYVQKSNNLQVWNEELDVERRYVLIRIDDNDLVTKIKVISGSDLANLDTTGTLTQKFQASLNSSSNISQLISNSDTDNLLPILAKDDLNLSGSSPIDAPDKNQIIPIEKCFELLKSLVGVEFEDVGSDQERNRGAALHSRVCKSLGYGDYRDNGQFPDVRHQLLEVKLQTSPTIDLGLVCPDSSASLDLQKIDGIQVRHCDVRYAIFKAILSGNKITITSLYLTSGKDFFSRFTQFQGRVLNKKIQIPLPRQFFNE